MALRVAIEGGGGTTSESVQEQNVLVQVPMSTVALASGPAMRIEVGVPALDVILLAPGYNETPPVMVLNDLADVEAAPADGSVLQYRDVESRWIAGFRLVFRPALRAYVISQ